MNIGLVCYASVGGSGVVATELAHELAGRGHQVVLISSELPFRWRDGAPGLSFVRVETPAYPLFREPQYLVALANTIAQVACDRNLDIVHAHYAVPHATAAFVADQILSEETGACRPRTVTTLHGTDITLVGADPSYRRVVAFSIDRSHGVTAVSESLRRDTVERVGVKRDIRVIPNFLDCDVYSRRPVAALRERLCPPADCEAVVMHVSNFRPVKRVDLVLDVFRRIHERVRARLVLVGDGPERPSLETEIAALGLGGSVEFVGEQHDLPGWLSAADLFLLPSSQESFGLAALEAMACEVPVVASRVGGLPEVIEDGVTGVLCDADDAAGMAERAVAILGDPALGRRLGQAAAESVRRRFCPSVVVPQYERYYREILDAR